MEIKISKKNGALLPEYATEGSAGMDIRAFVDAPVTIAPGCRALVPTGLFFEIPMGYEAQIRARSGLAVKYGIGLTNSVGTIDSDYRGEIQVSLINHGSEDFVIENGDRIAQVVFARIEHITWAEGSRLADTTRGAGGFGHTGRD